MSLEKILNLVGKLDDSPGEEAARERFRRYLLENLTEVGQVRDFVEECLRRPGDQYNRSLQDLINHVGHFLEFEVIFGRYRGVSGQVGFDGLWKSPTGFHVVVEVKTTETYTIKTSALVGYIDELISQNRIASWEDAIGLYVVGRPDPEVNQLENAIVAEKRTNQLRLISAESLLTLAEMFALYDIGHEDILSIIQPSGPKIDSVVNLMKSLVVMPEVEEPPVEAFESPHVSETSEVSHWLTPVKADEVQTAEEVIKTLVGEEEVYAFADRTPGRKHIAPGDWICFYATGNGVVGHARVVSKPEKKSHSKVRKPEKYRWTFKLEDPVLYLESPVVIDATTRIKLDAFANRNPNRPWAWFVQATRKITNHDFRILTWNQAEARNG